MKKLLLATATLLALASTATADSWYDIDQSCDGGEGESHIRKGGFSIYETDFTRVSPLKQRGAGIRSAIYHVEAEGEDNGTVEAWTEQVKGSKDWAVYFPAEGKTVILYYCGEM